MKKTRKNKLKLHFPLLNIFILTIFIITLGFTFYLIRKSPTNLINKTAQIVPTPIASFTPRNFSEQIRLPILIYHYVENVTDTRDTIRKSLNITPQVFKEQLNTLINTNYHPVHFDDLVKYYETGEPLPQNPVILTFDDGYRDFYIDVFPIIKNLKIPVTIYVVSGFLDSTKNYLTKDMLREIAKSDLVEIASHSTTHANLKFLGTEFTQEEIVNSKKILEEITGKKILHFAYPYGAYNNTLFDILNNAGYKTAVTTDKGIMQNYSDRFKLTRIRPGNTTGSSLLKLFEH